MLSYFHMQLRIHFRQLSSYIFPLIMGVFYIIIVITTKMTVKDEDNVIGILTSTVFHTGMINLSIFISFMISTFVAQTIYYKYRVEGVEPLLYSKPLSRTNVYIANILAAIICILFSILIITAGFFFSLLFYPKAAINFELIAKRTGSFLLAMFFSTILILAIGSVIQSFVEMKVYLVIAGVIPFIIVLVLSFIKSPGQVDNVSTINSAYKKMSLLISSKEDPTNKEINRIKKTVEEGNDLVVYNKNDKEVFNFLEPNVDDKQRKKRLDFIQTAEKAEGSLYKKIFWMNIEEYFLPLFSSYNLNLIKSSNFVKHTRINIIERPKGIENPNYDYKLSLPGKDKSQDINNLGLDSKFLFKIEEEVDGQKILNYYALSYDQNTINEYFRSKKGIDIEEIQSLVLSGASSLNISKLFSSFKIFNNLYIDELIKYRNSDEYVLKEYFKDPKNKFKNYEFNFQKLQEIALALSNDKKIAEITQNVIDAILPPLSVNASNYERITYNTKKEEIKQGLIKASMFMLIAKEISDQGVIYKRSQIENFLKQDNNFDLIKKYNMSFLKLTPITYYNKKTKQVESNFVKFNRYTPITPLFSVIFHTVISLTLFAIGLEIVKRKNYK